MFVDFSFYVSFVGLFRAAVPSGASTGVHEAVELRDSSSSAYMKKGVLNAVKNVNTIIAPQLQSKKFKVTDQADIDKFMIGLDGTDNKGEFLLFNLYCKLIFYGFDFKHG